MKKITTSPLTDDVSDSTESDVFEIVWFRATSTDDEWNLDPASAIYDLSRDEAARRLKEKDYSPLQ